MLKKLEPDQGAGKERYSSEQQKSGLEATSPASLDDKPKQLIEFSPDQSRNIPVEGTSNMVSPKKDETGASKQSPGPSTGSAKRRKGKAPSPIGKAAIYIGNALSNWLTKASLLKTELVQYSRNPDRSTAHWLKSTRLRYIGI